MKSSNQAIKKRRTALTDYLKGKQTATISELSQQFNVSEMTIRRDCEILAKMGLLERSFGKIVYVEQTVDKIGSEDPLDKLKDKLAKEASNLISDGQIIFINSSNTAVKVLEYLADKNITVLTNNLHALGYKKNSKTSIFLSGGEVNFAKEVMIGDIAFNSFKYFSLLAASNTLEIASKSRIIALEPSQFKEDTSSQDALGLAKLLLYKFVVKEVPF